MMKIWYVKWLTYLLRKVNKSCNYLILQNNLSLSTPLGSLVSFQFYVL